MTSAKEARRIAVTAQGLAGERPSKTPNRAAVLGVIDRLGVLQIDSVNVLARAHYLPLFARLGPYDPALLDTAAWSASSSKPRALFEYWGHMASFLPAPLHRLFRWRMDRARRGVGTYGRIARFAKEKKAYCDRVVEEIRARGPVGASGLEALGGAAKKAPGWWEWSEAKVAVETLFWQGRLTVATRKNFERLYDVPERVLPAEVLDAPTPSDADAHRELVAISARALGIATADDLCDYFRLKQIECRPHIAELIEAGTLIPTTVEGWNRPAWIHRDFAKPKWKPGAALVGPFDPIVWYRARAHRLFDFHYRIGIYTPAHQRTHGYYVMPFLLGDSLVARVDLKADRKASALLVQSAWLEAGQKADDVAGPLKKELGEMAKWLGLEKVKIARRGTLAPALKSER